MNLGSLRYCINALFKHSAGVLELLKQQIVGQNYFNSSSSLLFIYADLVPDQVQNPRAAVNKDIPSVTLHEVDSPRKYSIC